MWGSDYPHGEGTFQRPNSEDDERATRLALRSTFAGLPAQPTRQVLGLNAVEVYGLDGDKLELVARRIGAPSLEDISEPYQGPPPGNTSLAFRTSKFA
jgi:hypothetical protein